MKAPEEAPIRFFPNSDKMFRALVETTPDTVIIADAHNRIVFCNDKIKSTFGYLPSQVLQQDLGMLVPHHLREAHRTGMLRFLESRNPKLIGKTVEMQGLHQNGTVFPMELSLSYWEEGGQVYFSSIIRDISRRKIIENNLVRERQYLSTILETAEEGIIACDENGELTFINRSAHRLFGEDSQQGFHNFQGRIHHMHLYFRDGRQVCRVEDLPLHRILQGEEFTTEEMEIKAPGKAKVVVLISGRRIRTAEGLHLGALAIFHNITDIRQQEAELMEKNRLILSALEELKLAELNLLKTNNELEQRVAERTCQLEHSNQELNQKNEELQQINADLDNFVYIASHDLKAPLLNLEALLSLLKFELQPDFKNKEKELVCRLDSTVQEMKQTIQDIARVAKVQRQDSMPAERIVLAALFQEISSSIDALIQEAGVNIQTDFQQAPEIYFAAVSLKSILNNLLSNAIKYRDPSRPPRILVRSFRQENYLVLQVQDNGLGIDLVRNGNKLFNMFSRLHTHVDGSGIGLYIVKRLVENNRGRIEVDSQEGRGTTFTLYLYQGREKENAG